MKLIKKVLLLMVIGLSFANAKVPNCFSLQSFDIESRGKDELFVKSGRHHYVFELSNCPFLNQDYPIIIRPFGENQLCKGDWVTVGGWTCTILDIKEIPPHHLNYDSVQDLESGPESY